MCEASEYYKTLFRSGMIESKNHEIYFNDISTEDLEVIITFIYTERTNLTEDNVIRILQYAHMVQLLNLVQCCIYTMVKNVRVETCLQYKRISKVYKINELHEISSDYLSKKTSDVLKYIFGNENIKDLDTKEILDSLDDEGFNIDHEPELYESVRDWVKSENEFRAKEMMSQINQVPEPKPPSYIRRLVSWLFSNKSTSNSEKTSTSVYNDSMLTTNGVIKTHLIIPTTRDGVCLYLRDGDKTWSEYRSVRYTQKNSTENFYVCGDGIFVHIGETLRKGETVS